MSGPKADGRSLRVLRSERAALHYWTSTSTSFRVKKLRAFQTAMELHPARNPGDVQGPQYTFLDRTRMHDPHEFIIGLTAMLKYLNHPHTIDRVE